jgi:hypothetical protein
MKYTAIHYSSRELTTFLEEEKTDREWIIIDMAIDG